MIMKRSLINIQDLKNKKEKQNKIKRKMRKKEAIIKQQDIEHKKAQERAAFKDWLKNSIDSLVAQKHKQRQESKLKKIEEANQKRKNEHKKVM